MLELGKGCPIAQTGTCRAKEQWIKERLAARELACAQRAQRLLQQQVGGLSLAQLPLQRLCFSCRLGCLALRSLSRCGARPGPLVCCSPPALRILQGLALLLHGGGCGCGYLLCCCQRLLQLGLLLARLLALLLQQRLARG